MENKGVYERQKVWKYLIVVLIELGQGLGNDCGGWGSRHNVREIELIRKYKSSLELIFFWIYRPIWMNQLLATYVKFRNTLIELDTDLALIHPYMPKAFLLELFLRCFILCMEKF